MKVLRSMCAVLLLTGVMNAGKVEEYSSSDKEVVVKGNNRFALELYAQLREGQDNLFFSPSSISTALAMTYAGALGNTQKQMAQVLHFELTHGRLHPAFKALLADLKSEGKEGGYELSIANALWGQKGGGFLVEFVELLKANYGAGLNEVDFMGAAEEARKTINAWVEKETRGKIKDLIKPGMLNPLTRLVLTNAIYFKGLWALPFSEKRTSDEPFTLPNGTKINVPMMQQTTEFNYFEEESFQALELGYAGDELSMVVFLPRKIENLPGLENSFTRENLETWLGKLSRRKVAVSLPRFRITSEFQLGGVLKAMGMTDAFAAPPADFSGMNGKKDLFLSAVIHKAFVDVNEEGTEAAAATAVIAAMTSAQPEPFPVFRADHPFVFLIRDQRSGSILFLGRVMDPGR